MDKLHTLTVPDMLWINLQVTGSPQKYNFATLEEGTFYQFQRQQSLDIPAQAARFLTGFKSLAPFAAGNEATAFVGCLTFLEMNHKSLNLTDEEAHELLKSVWSGHDGAADKVAGLIHDHHSHTSETDIGPRKLIEEILGRYANTLALLSA